MNWNKFDEGEDINIFEDVAGEQQPADEVVGRHL